MDSLGASSSSSNQQWKYDVFLSFRGEDTRNNFTSHLYKELKRKGIETFKDDRELRKGESVPQQLPKAIHESRLLVIIFSENYATSTWCLKELVQIYECHKAGRQKALPIFYKVDPSEVRKQKGKYGEPFAEYEKLHKEHVQQWRVASTDVANLSGWDLKDRDESDFIEDIANTILGQLRRSGHYSIAKNFVGMDSRLEKMRSYIDLGQLDKVRSVGIREMGGIGKTTIARVVYKELLCQFEGSCFLENVRESCQKYGIVWLQKQLLSATLGERNMEVYDVDSGTDEIRNRLGRKKVLVILDDVDRLEHLELLIGKRDDCWFGLGSRIIITTRDQRLLDLYGVDETYRVEKLNSVEALQLFCSKAFKNNDPEGEYLELSKKVLEYADGLPLALTILGNSLCDKPVRIWECALNKLKEIPNNEILSKLQISYDGLDEISQKVFLDIACFFKDREISYVKKILEICGLFPDSGIDELIDKSLIAIECGSVRMHDLIQEMGQGIVRGESPEEPGKRSRIWLYKDLYEVQMKDMETIHAKAIVLPSWEQGRKQLSAKVFSKAEELRLLILPYLSLYREDIEYLSNELRYMEWCRCPFKSFPTTFQPYRLVELHLRCSNIEQLWSEPTKTMEFLKTIDLSNSRYLIRTPNFEGVPNLEELSLEGCIRLQEVHRSIGVLNKLVRLNLKNCESLKALPDSICKLNSLKIFILCGCSKLEKFPEKVGDMTSLQKFDASEVGKTLVELANRNWYFRLSQWLIPRRNNPHPMAMAFASLSALPFLTKLDLSNCNIPEGALPNELNGFPSLRDLNLSGNNFITIPSSISKLSQLRRANFSNCKKLEYFPDQLPCNLKILDVSNCTSLERLPNAFVNQDCASLERLPNAFENQDVTVEFRNCTNLNDHQGNINVALAWLKNYLISFLDYRQWMKTEDYRLNPHYMFLHIFGFSMQFPGREIPVWFNLQIENPSNLRIPLPENTKWWNIVGFAVCAVISENESRENEPPICCLDFKSGDKSISSFLRNLTISEILKPAKNHLYIFFHGNRDLDPEEKCGSAEVLLNFRGIKKCGIRVIKEENIQDLEQLKKCEIRLIFEENIQDLDQPKEKFYLYRFHDDNCDSEEEELLAEQDEFLSACDFSDTEEDD